MLFGTIKNFDEIEGTGSIQPANGDSDLQFEKSAVSWGKWRADSAAARPAHHQLAWHYGAKADQPVSETLGEWGIERLRSDQYRAKGVRYAIAGDAIAQGRRGAMTGASMASFALTILVVGSALAYSFW